MSKLANELIQLGIFTSLVPEEYALLGNHLTEKTYLDHAVILKQSEIGGQLFIITAGRVDITVRLPGNYEKRATQLEKGQLFGEVAFLAHEPITASVTAVGEVTCILFSSGVLEMLRIAYPQIAYKIERDIARQANNKISFYLERLRNLLQSVAIHHPVTAGHGRFLPQADAKEESYDKQELNYSIIKKIPTFSNLLDDEIALLLPFFSVKHFDKGFDFTRNNRNDGTINIIYAGAVMLFMKNGKQLMKSLDVIGVGELFLKNSADQDLSHIASYVTCERSIILQLSLKHYVQLHRQYPAIFFKVSQFVHSTIVGSIYILNREFVRINCEYSDLIS